MAAKIQKQTHPSLKLLLMRLRFLMQWALHLKVKILKE